MAGRKYLKWKVARLVGVCEKTIIRWERKGIIPKSHRTAGGWRYWTIDQINIIKQVAGV